MLHYPLSFNETCKYCGSLVTMERQGDGHPGHGRLNYWYTTNHSCVESEQALAAQQADRDFLEKAIFGSV